MKENNPSMPDQYRIAPVWVRVYSQHRTEFFNQYSEATHVYRLTTFTYHDKFETHVLKRTVIVYVTAVVMVPGSIAGSWQNI